MEPEQEWGALSGTPHFLVRYFFGSAGMTFSTAKVPGLSW